MTQVHPHTARCAMADIVVQRLTLGAIRYILALDWCFGNYVGQNLLAFGTVSKKDAFTEDVIGFLPSYPPF